MSRICGGVGERGCEKLHDTCPWTLGCWEARLALGRCCPRNPPPQGIHLTPQGLTGPSEVALPPPPWSSTPSPGLSSTLVPLHLTWVPTGPFTPAISPVKPASPTGNLYPPSSIQVFRPQNQQTRLFLTPSPQACWFCFCLSPQISPWTKPLSYKQQ